MTKTKIETEALLAAVAAELKQDYPDVPAKSEAELVALFTTEPEGEKK